MLVAVQIKHETSLALKTIWPGIFFNVNQVIMKSNLLIIVLCCTIAAAACTVQGRVITSRPDDIVYSRPVSPGPDYIWIDGDWVWEGGNYRWHEGRWDRRREGREWHRGQWEAKGNGWRWHRGYWK
jgi:hypothetical protein